MMAEPVAEKEKEEGEKVGGSSAL